MSLNSFTLTGANLDWRIASQLGKIIYFALRARFPEQPGEPGYKFYFFIRFIPQHA